MSSDEPPTPDAGGGDQPPQIVVDDPEDMAKTRKLRSIFDAADDYIEARREANELHDTGQIDFATKNKQIYRYMQDFAMQLEPLLISYDEGTEIWEERTYGIEDKPFVAAGELLSPDEAVSEYVDFVDDHLSGAVTDDDLRIILEIADLDVPASRLKEAIEDMRPAEKQPQRPEPAISVEQALQMKHVDAAQIAAANSQQTTQRKQPSPDAERIVSMLKSQTRPSSWVSRDDKFSYKLREAFTDWGWEVQGLKNLIDDIPKLAYPKAGHKKEFGHTAPLEEVSNAAYRDMQQFLDDIGLGVQFDETNQTKVGDDLLEEVDDWRADNV